MRVSPLLTTVIRADANYFVAQGFENSAVLKQVEDWLAGKDVPEIEPKIMSWIESDAKWIEEVKPFFQRRYWLLWPIVTFVLWHIHRRLNWWLENIRSTSTGGVKK